MNQAGHMSVQEKALLGGESLVKKFTDKSGKKRFVGIKKNLEKSGCGP